MNVRILHHSGIALYVLILQACRQPNIQTADLIGQWNSEDGAKILLGSDGNCLLENIKAATVTLSANDTGRMSIFGTWRLVSDDNSGITGGIKKAVGITYRLPGGRGAGAIVLYISGQGFNESNPPWDLFMWEGDPDEMSKYKFIRQTQHP